MACVALAPVEREVVRCHSCLLNQFMPRNKHCRKCKVNLAPKVEAPALELIKIPGFSRTYDREYANRADDSKSPRVPQVRFGLAVMVLRVRLSLTQPQLAARMKVSRQYVCKIERGRGLPWVDKISRFSEALEVTPYQLVDLATV